MFDKLDTSSSLNQKEKVIKELETMISIKSNLSINL